MRKQQRQSKGSHNEAWLISWIELISH